MLEPQRVYFTLMKGVEIKRADKLFIVTEETEKIMTPETKYKLISSIPFQVLGLLFVISCIVSNYFYQNQSEYGQEVTWGSFVVIVIGFLVYILIKNRKK